MSTCPLSLCTHYWRLLLLATISRSGIRELNMAEESVTFGLLVHLQVPLEVWSHMASPWFPRTLWTRGSGMIYELCMKKRSFYSHDTIKVVYYWRCTFCVSSFYCCLVSSKHTRNCKVLNRWWAQVWNWSSFHWYVIEREREKMYISWLLYFRSGSC